MRRPAGALAAGAAGLIVLAVAVRRWLASGEGGARNGIVPHRLLASEVEALARAASATVFMPGAAPAHAHEEPAIGGGGRSGGAGATGSY
jgi:hypothetical protein